MIAKKFTVLTLSATPMLTGRIFSLLFNNYARPADRTVNYSVSSVFAMTENLDFSRENGAWASSFGLTKSVV